MLTDDEAATLGNFRRYIERAELADLAPVIASTLDELVDLLRGLRAGGLGTELAAALAAELHRRRPPVAPMLRIVGNA